MSSSMQEVARYISGVAYLEHVLEILRVAGAAPALAYEPDVELEVMDWTLYFTASGKRVGVYVAPGRFADYPCAEKDDVLTKFFIANL